ncbi:saccharopine dehydrogenase NADP-binding domain-containing protein [Verrucomicrobia bacterium]|nr:saccharopine dehydrogenase NADP-binding domain-containing protein [Verrucomicrobiota bacterium]MDG1890597.1 saccharopine dehydrogenase NADP-binding domain-containing protein [Verrucomicrobiota bacterium]
MVINVAIPYQNLAVMKACLRTGLYQMDISADDKQRHPRFDYALQWAFDTALPETPTANLNALNTAGLPRPTLELD